MKSKTYILIALCWVAAILCHAETAEEAVKKGEILKECRNNLLQTGFSLMLYASDHNGSFPSASDGLKVLEKETDQAVFKCPADGRPYHYIPGRKYSGSEDVVAYCDGHKNQSGTEYLNVLFSNGRVGQCAISVCTGGSGQQQTVRPEGLWYEKFFNEDFVNASGQKVPVSVLKGKMVGFYFSASWCGPCRGFTPKLVSFYNQTAGKNNLEIVFISLDKTGEAMMQYMTKDAMPWPAVPFGSSAGRQLKRQLKVGGIPAFVIFDSYGKKLSSNARWDVVMLGSKAADAWRSPDYKPLTFKDYKASLNGNGTPGHPAAGNGNNTASWLPGPTKLWHIRMDDALTAAQKENKKLFVLVTGSDWCGWCKKLYKEVLSTPDFTSLAKEKMVLFYLDNPRRKPMPEIQKMYNMELAKAVLNRSGGVPCTCIFNGQGQLLGTINGYRALPQYMQELQKILDSEAVDSQSKRLPQWVQQSPEQLTPMLEQRLAKKKKAADRAQKEAEAVKKNASFQVVAWGLDKNDVNSPFDPRQEIRVPIRTNIYVKVKYSLPSGIKSQLFLRDSKGLVSSSSTRISGNGETVFSLSCPRPCRPEKIVFLMRLFMRESKLFTAFEIPCRLVWE